MRFSVHQEGTLHFAFPHVFTALLSVGALRVRPRERAVKSIVTTLVFIAAASPAHASKRIPAADFQVNVCAEPFVSGVQLSAARITASDLFARIGIRLIWRVTTHCPAGAIQIRFSTATPENLNRGALAYALPYEGTHIVIILDRVMRIPPKDRMQIFLAYVMAHEITHVLQAVSRHSDTGLMKAHWDEADYFDIVRGKLTFTRDDIDLIYMGVARRLRSELVPVR